MRSRPLAASIAYRPQSCVPRLLFSLAMLAPVGQRAPKYALTDRDGWFQLSELRWPHTLYCVWCLT